MNLKPLDFKCFDFELPIVGCRVSYRHFLEIFMEHKDNTQLAFPKTNKKICAQRSMGTMRRKGVSWNSA
ncbi:hypothetical protein B9Q04_13550 [Candidatus Marsarchaeota G2 archaeon BE_D]|uniref:Uncharacterized protein n=1 Tax=Candidatus Marsarchaeota G2 archaeon BE_D TaxID=1978158 RepID=A0A2R6C7U3_9ARCH|nr:MAG: hypothetical protein B9Q04_13550 [Candidatus Marsarchaeota G2 archaeon BE_D]